MCPMLQTKKASEKSFDVLPRGKGMAEETGGEAKTIAGLCLVKPKFHYADFATKSGKSSRQSRGLVADTNHVADFHDLCSGLS